MTDTRDPRITELVTRLVEQAPAAPPFPDEITVRPDAPRRRVALAGAALAAALVVASVVFVATRPKDKPAPVSPSTTTPTTTAPLSPPLVQPSALAVDNDQTLYVADIGAHRIVTIGADGEARLFAPVGQPRALTFGPDRALYVADTATNTVLRVTRDGQASTYAGDGSAGFAGDGGPATAAKLREPTGLAFGPDDALYIADGANARVRRVDPNGTISTFSVSDGSGGPPLNAALDPRDLAFDGAGNLVVFHFSTKAIVRIDHDGIISSAESRYVSGLATNPSGDVVLADYGGFGISYLAPNGTIFNLPFEHTGLFRPTSIAVSPNGDVYVADDGRSAGGPMRIMRVHPDGTSIDITPGAHDVPEPSTPDPRSAAGAVPFVETLVAERGLPHADAVRSVRALGDFMVVSTSLVDATQAAELWEALSLRLGCDDSHLLVRGYHVLLADGSKVAAPRPGFKYCAGT